MGGLGGGGNVGPPVAQPGPNVMQPSAMPPGGAVPMAPPMPNMRAAPAPNFGTPASPPPQLAAGTVLPAQKAPLSRGAQLTAVGKALQTIGERAGQQQQRRGMPVNFNTPNMPFIPPPNSGGYTGNGD